MTIAGTTMFQVLVESAPTRQGRRTAAAAVSAVVHVTLAAVLLAITANGAALLPGGRFGERVVTLVRLSSPAAAPRERRIFSRAGGGDATRAGKRPARETRARKGPGRGEGEGEGAGRSRRSNLPAIPQIDVPVAEVASLYFFDSTLVERAAPSDEFLAGAFEREGVQPMPDQILAGVYRESDTERRPVPLLDSPRPEYPDRLLRMRVQGAVIAKFVIDSTGRPVVPSLEILQSSDELFTRSVKQVIRHMRYSPAQIAGRAVNVLVEQPFTFVMRY